jgi:DNA-directed RNA polymerase II subunit RPB2
MSGKCNLRDKNMKEKIDLGECENDFGGYFIIRGKERVLIGQERINYNQIYIFEQKNINQKFPFVAEIRSISEETAHSVLTQAKISNDGRTIVFSLPYIKVDVPAGIVLKALGIETYEDISRLLGENPKFEKFINWIIRSAKQTPSREDALRWIGSNPIHSVEPNKTLEYANQILNNEVFPHLGFSTAKEISIYLGSMISKLLYTLLGIRKEDDRDNISLKRVETAGTLIGDLFRMLLKRFIDTAKKYIVKRPDIMVIMSRVNNITTGIRHSFSTGNWGVQKNTYIRTGVSQILSRLTYAATVSHLRRVVIPIGKEGKNTKIRQLHPTQVFFICPCESPDGQSIGILKNLAFSARITQPSSGIWIRNILSMMKTIEKLDISELGKSTKILINGIYIGITRDPKLTIQEIRKFRKNKILPNDVSVAHDVIDNEINIF